MENQLKQARDWAAATSAAEAERMKSVADLEYTYDGVQLDRVEDMPLIQDFIDHVEWYLPSRTKDRTIPGLMLKAVSGGRFLPMKNIYVDRVGAAHHYISLYGADWRAHVRSIG